jgi:UDP-glucose 4-epimerase
MRILITGGAGFLGSHLVDRLIAAGHGVIVLDDLSTGSRLQLEEAAGSDRFEFHRGCVTDLRLVSELARGVDRIVHLASTVGVDRVAAAPEWTREVVEDGTAAVIACAAARRTPALIVTSSEVYGFAPRVPVGESELPEAIEGDAPRLAYARAKLAADRAALAAAAAGLPVRVVRPFNLIGPRQREDGGAVLPSFVGKALRGETLRVHGDGSQRRTLLDVRDAADVLLRVALAEFAALPAALNLGGSVELTMAQLASEVVAALHASSAIETIAPPAARGGIEVARRVPDLSRLAALGMLPATRPLAATIQSVAASLDGAALAV